MPWARMDDHLPENPKVALLSDAAFRAYIESICYCARNLTDGAIPPRLAARLGAIEVDELIEAGLFDLTPEGLPSVHDYLVYNPTREKVLADRASAAERKEKSRKESRRADAVTSPVTSPVTDGVSHTHPVPGPVPVPKPQPEPKSKELSRSALDNEFELFLDAYPRRDGKIAARKAFEKARRAGVAFDVLVAGATRYALDPNREPEFTPYAQRWLNEGRWSDDPLPARSNGKPRRDRAREIAADAARLHAEGR